MNQLKPYSAYKDSGVSWLGEIPKHWRVQRIKSLFREIDLRSGDGQGTLLSLTRKKGIIPQSEASKRIASTEDLSKYRVCKPGNLVMNRMQAWSGMFGVSKVQGLISPDYCVFQPISEGQIQYFEYLFKTPPFVRVFAQFSKGIGSGFNRLYTPDFGRIPAITPSISEQISIVRYIGHVDNCISQYLRSKRKLIELLNEQKQAIIHKAVTNGLDPNVRLKSSDLEWLGEVPEHWDIKRNKYFMKEISDYSKDGSEELLTVSQYTGITKRRDSQSDERNLITTANSLEGYKKVMIDDLVMNIMLAWNGSLGVSLVNGIASPAYCVFRFGPEVEPRFMHYLLRTPLFTGVFKTVSTGVIESRLRLYPNVFLSLPSLLPPISEQVAIANYLDAATANVNKLIELSQRKIKLLLESRIRLVTDIVTGKLDVREVAANLPKEIEVQEENDIMPEEPETVEEDELEPDTAETEDA
jgi:type I restriction enzyme, S subunit